MCTAYQRRGIGSALLQHLLSLAQTSAILVGTWEDARRAAQFYQQYGFTLVSREEKDVPLQEYWNNPGGKSRHRVYLRKDL
ncbi:MAG: GNAT family N-acetyltransferase [Halobacteriota archaeon]